MTFNPYMTAELPKQESTQQYMAIVDDLGQEIPITEMDIRRSLKVLEKDTEHDNHAGHAMDQLLERVYAARAIA